MFNSAKDGESFSKFHAALTNPKTSRTPTLVIVWEDSEDGNVFGGYGSHPWAVGPKFFGDNTSFLFNLHPKKYNYEALRYNSNYYTDKNIHILKFSLFRTVQFETKLRVCCCINLFKRYCNLSCMF